MAQRKKRSPSKKSSKKHIKTTKRQFLAAIPQAFPTGLLPAFSLPTAPFTGPSSPAFPSFPLAQTQSPMAFKPSAFPTFPAKPAPARLSGMKLDTLGARRMPMLSPFSGFPYAAQNSPFVKVPQFQNANFFRGTSSSPWAPLRQSMSGKHDKRLMNKCCAKFKLVIWQTHWSASTHKLCCLFQLCSFQKQEQLYFLMAV